VPLQRVPLIQGAYTAQNVIAAAQRCLNLYPEKNPQGEDSPFTLNLTPGLSRLGVPAEASPVRGLYRASNGQGFAAVGSGIYAVAANWTTTLLGTTAVNTTPVKMGDNGTTMTIVDGSAFGWLVDLATLAYSAQTDPNFFGSNFVESLDTFQLFNQPGGVFYCSLSDSTTFDPLYFANKVGYPDLLAGIAVQNRNPWLIGAQQTSEIWFDAGATDFPFQIMPGPFVEHGADSVYSIAKQGGSVFWSSQDANGNTIIVEGTNFTTRKISTPAIEYAISTYPVTSDAIGFCYEQRGHAFYWLKFPSANGGLGADWVYDLSTQLWHERSWLNPATCEPEGHRAFCQAWMYGVNVVGDRQNGQLYALDPNNPTDAGAFIERRRGYPHFMANGARASYPRLIADMQAGTIGSSSAPAGLPSGIASTTTYPTDIVVIDTTFTATDGTLLEDYNYPPDIGSQYSRLPGSGISAEIENDQLTGDGSGSAYYLASGVPTSADYVVQFNAVPAAYDGIPAVDKGVFAIGRSLGASGGAGYQVFITSNGAEYVAIISVLAVSSQTVSMGTIPSGYWTVYLSMQGTTISVAIRRSIDGYWLLESDAAYSPVFQTCFSIDDDTYTAAADVLIGGIW
jgi:hypothetical protein